MLFTIKKFISNFNLQIVMSSLDTLIGFTTLASAASSGLVYGLSDGQGVSLPGRGFIWSATGALAYYYGAKPSHPNHNSDRKVGVVCTATAAVLGTASYGVGYFLGSFF